MAAAHYLAEINHQDTKKDAPLTSLKSTIDTMQHVDLDCNT